ncbi:hypothetical protein V1511DRAFT_455323 [Dipodascopsis uninucleata]
MPFLKGIRSRSASDPSVNETQASGPNRLDRDGDILPLPAEGRNHTTPFYRTLSAPSVSMIPPPEYPLDAELPPGRFKVSPRDEEGCEDLPPYSSTLFRAAILSRKMELISPVETAPSRSWNSVIVVLNNTQLNIYRTTGTLAYGSSMSVGNSSHGNSNITSLTLPWRSSSYSSSSSGNCALHSSSIVNEDTINPFCSNLPLTPSTSASSSSVSLSQSSTSLSPVSSSSSVPTMATVASYLGMSESALDKSRLIRSYTLQYAQIGLATDYKKKLYVLRVRAEGQQFLLSCSNARECVEWTAALQAACDLALPLEDRVIPRYRSIPSRRRRRILPSARSPSHRQRQEDNDNGPLSWAAARPVTSVPDTADGEENGNGEGDGHNSHDEEDENEYYYRRNRQRSSSNASAATNNTGEGHAESEDEDHVGPLPSREGNHNSLSSSRSIVRNSIAIPHSFSIYSDMLCGDENDSDEKWMPAIPRSSTGSRIRYALRCMYSLPANASWGDKLLMTKGDKFIVRERILIN